MLIEINDNFMNEIIRLSEVANLTPGDFIEATFKNTQHLKDDLLEEKKDFSNFIEDYHFVLSNLTDHQEKLVSSIKEINDSPAMESVFEELIRLSSDDIWLLSKLYKKYKEHISLTQLS